MEPLLVILPLTIENGGGTDSREVMEIETGNCTLVGYCGE